MQWTDEQRRIIDLENSNLLVSAAAGSGKTAVLVERIIKLVKQGDVDIDNFLVVTFTNAAAAGMKQKIQKALVKSAKEEGNTRHIKRQLSLLNKAQITTLHSFCLDIVKKNFHIIGIDPGFRVGDTSELNILLQESIDEVLERAYTDPCDDFHSLVESYTKNRGDEDLSTILKNTYKFILSFSDPLKWLENSVNNLKLSEEEFRNSPWYKEIIDYIVLQLNGAKDLINVGIEICYEADGPELYIETLNEDLLVIDDLLSLVNTDLESFINANKGKIFKDIPRAYNKNNPAPNEEKKDYIKDKLRKEYRDIVTTDSGLRGIFPYDSLDKYLEEINHMYGAINILKDLLVDLYQTYRAKKIEKSLVDFNDFEHYALEILRNDDGPSDIAKAYQEKLKYIFIDEYQDSNSIQETIINQIKREDNLFMVGDVKQSIYRFRLADPSLFNQKYDDYDKDKGDLHPSVKDRVIELNKNFRSRAEILDATNYIFKSIMSKEMGEIDYNPDVYLYNGNEFPNTDNVELHLLEKIRNDSEEGDDNRDYTTDDDTVENIEEQIASMEKAEFEAMFIVGKIRDLLTQQTYDSAIEDFRNITYKDIVILMRAVKDWALIFEEIFSKEGIPFFFDGGSGYYQATEIQLIINLLKTIDNAKQDIPLVSVMRSPIGNFTTEELAEIRSKSIKGEYYDACLNYKEGRAKLDYSQDIIGKLDKLFTKIDDWSRRSKYTDLSDLIWEILLETGYYKFVGALPNGKLRQANLRLLTDKAFDFEKTSMRGLFKFLNYIEKLRESSEDKTSTAKTLGENDDVVRLMTIHNSKGLEYPVVILANLGKQFNTQDTRSKILLDKDYGIGSKYINPELRQENQTLSRKAISHKIDVENLSEEMRVLYVAMTRAIDKLIMVGSIEDINDKIKKWRRGHSKYFVYKSTSYLDWIGSCLFKGVNEDGISDILERGTHKDWIVRKVPYFDIIRDSLDNKDEKIAERLAAINSYEDKSFYEEIGRRLNFKYSYEQSTRTPSKLSVTESNSLDSKDFQSLRYNIPSLTNYFDFDEKGNKVIEDKMVYSGTEIGTLIHLVMENIDIKGNLDEDDIRNQLKKLTAKNLLREAEERYVIKNYLDKIHAFYNSELGLRLRKSDLVKKEVPFVLKKKASTMLENLNENDDILIQGIIDCYFYDGDEVVIIDYKTDSVKANGIEDIKEKYKGQIALYKEAIEKIENKKVKESYIYLMSLGIVVEV